MPITVLNAEELFIGAVWGTVGIWKSEKLSPSGIIVLLCKG
jgi:hypothetical protein